MTPCIDFTHVCEQYRVFVSGWYTVCTAKVTAIFVYNFDSRWLLCLCTVAKFTIHIIAPCVDWTVCSDCQWVSNSGVYIYNSFKIESFVVKSCYNLTRHSSCFTATVTKTSIIVITPCPYVSVLWKCGCMFIACRNFSYVILKFRIRISKNFSRNIITICRICIVHTKLTVYISTPCIYNTACCKSRSMVTARWNTNDWFKMFCFAEVCYDNRYIIIFRGICSVYRTCLLLMSYLTWFVATPCVNCTVCHKCNWMIFTGGNINGICNSVYKNRIIAIFIITITKLTFFAAAPCVNLTVCSKCKSVTFTGGNLHNVCKCSVFT